VRGSEGERGRERARVRERRYEGGVEREGERERGVRQRRTPPLAGQKKKLKNNQTFQKRRQPADIVSSS